jgi:hypothetical protein
MVQEMAEFKKIVKNSLFASFKLIAAPIVHLLNGTDCLVKMAFEAKSHPVTADWM